MASCGPGLSTGLRPGPTAQRFATIPRFVVSLTVDGARSDWQYRPGGDLRTRVVTRTGCFSSPDRALSAVVVVAAICLGGNFFPSFAPAATCTRQGKFPKRFQTYQVQPSATLSLDNLERWICTQPQTQRPHQWCLRQWCLPRHLHQLCRRRRLRHQQRRSRATESKRATTAARYDFYG